MSDTPAWMRDWRVVEGPLEGQHPFLFRVEREGQLAWLLRNPALGALTVTPPPAHPHLVEQLDHFDADGEAVFVFESFDGLPLDQIAREHFRLVAVAQDASCPECSAAVNAYRTEFGIQILCEGCGGMFDPKVLPWRTRERGETWGTPLWLDYAIGIVSCCADALMHCHHHGVSFHDVNPDRIVIRDDGVVRMLAPNIRFRDDAPSPTNPSPMSWRRYQSPERAQLLELGPTHHVYALAALLYEMTVGQHPIGFHGGSFAFLDRLINGQPTRPTELLGDYPAVLDELIMEGLSNEPAARPSIRELASRLDDFAEAQSFDLSSEHLRDYLTCLRPADSQWPRAIFY